MRAFFVTGAGTGVGKTHVAAQICRRARAMKLSALALKPVLSGYDPDDAADCDSVLLLKALGLQPTPDAVAAISPWRFKAPLSPDMAAAREGRAVPFPALLDFCRTRLRGAEDLLLIEGIGGAMVPLTETETVLDWMAALKLPAILVTGSYLGCLSHTLTAARAIEGRDVPIAVVAVSESEESPVPLAETVATLGRFLPAVPIVGFARDDNSDGAAVVATVLGLG